MEQYLSTILSSLFSIYLPIEETGTRLAISLALAQMISIYMVKIGKAINCLDSLYHYFWKTSYVIIDVNNPFHEKMIEYYYQKYVNIVTGCKFDTQRGKNIMIIDRLKKSDIEEEYIFDDKKYKIKIRFTNDDVVKKNEDSKEKNINNISKKNILISGKCDIKILECYINNLIRFCNQKVKNKVVIYKLTVFDGQDRHVEWYGRSTKISKNINNTIVSDNVKKNFYDDVHDFINNEQYYTNYGLPYKRGYVLHGEPGTGKTSLIKAIANEYQLPIFIIDLSILKNNSELTKIVNDINHFVAKDQKHLVVFEDVDRSKTFGRYYSKITDDCLLNILDGIDENYGRITILTTNDLKVIKCWRK